MFLLPMGRKVIADTWASFLSWQALLKRNYSSVFGSGPCNKQHRGLGLGEELPREEAAEARLVKGLMMLMKPPFVVRRFWMSQFHLRRKPSASAALVFKFNCIIGGIF